jgi:Zn-dependent oligopeptidase
MTNSLIHPAGEVRFSTYKPEDVKEAIDHAIKLAKSRIKKLHALKGADLSFNRVLEFTRSDEELQFITGVVMHLESMQTSKWSEAKDYVLDEYSKFSLSVQFDRKIYDLLKSVQAKSTSCKPYEKRLINQLIKDYEDNGINLPKTDQKRLKTLSKRSITLSSRFKSNILIARDSRPLVIKTEKQLAGVRSDLIESYRSAAKEKGLSGYLVAVDDGNFDVIMTSCSVSKTRRKMHKIYTSCVSKKNNKLLFELLKIRRETASILGYETPAHMLMTNRMVTEPERAMKFVEDLMNRYAEKAKQEYRDLLTYVQNHHDKKAVELEQFEFDSGLNLYYPAKYFEHLYKLNLEDTKAYFEFNKVRSYMFDCLAKLYSVRFEASSTKSWHKDVEVYDIYDSSNNHIAQVHCDWFSRKDKHGHAWMNEFVIADRKTTEIKPHVGCVIMNLSPATDTTPSLMSVDSVETMWHEFGHFMHLAFSDTYLKEQSMMNVKRDFVEAPSQIMENWVLHPDVLPHYALHYKTGEPLPIETVATVKKMSLYNVGIKAMRQLYFAYLDLSIHADRQFSSPDDMAAFAKDVREKYLPVKATPYFSTLSTFGHITGGYAAGYYTYKWSESIQADLFSRFETEGVLNPHVGEAYKSLVLARGDEVDPDELIVDFLGRPSTPKAMLERDGV